MARSCLILIFVCLWTFGHAQSTPPKIGNDSATTKTNKPKGSFANVFQGQPGKAALYSLIVPGGGQIYNKRYWKLPLVWAGEGFAIYNLIQQRNIYNDLNNCNIALINGETDPPICGGVNNQSTAFSRAQAARSNKELSYLFVGLAHLLNVLDAFIDRHLINFDTTDDLSLRLFQNTQNVNNQHFTSTSVKLFQVNISLNNLGQK